jgi:hypothetical protein
MTTVLYETTFARCFENLLRVDRRALTVQCSLLGYMASLTLHRHRFHRD